MTKKKTTTEKPLKNKARRSFLQGAAVVAGAAGVAAAGAGCDQAPITSSGEHPLDAGRVQFLLNDAKLREQWLKTVGDLVKQAQNDTAMREKLFTRTDCVQLVNLYNQHGDAMEQIVGRKVDGRTLEGRLFKVIVAAELFVGVAGFDYGYEGDVYEDQGSCCSFFIGCCVTHFWDNNYYARTGCDCNCNCNCANCNCANCYYGGGGYYGCSGYGG